MRRITMPLLGVLLAVVALSAVASASASAEVCKKKAGTKSYDLCIAGEKVGTQTETKKIGFTSKLPAGASASIHTNFGEMLTTCTSTSTESGTISSGGGVSAKMTGIGLVFSSCKVVLEDQPTAKCRLRHEPLLWAGEEGKFGPLAENVNINKEPTFGSMEFSGESCPYFGLPGEYRIKSSGGPKCTISEAEVETATKELVCNPENSRLEFEGNPAQLNLKQTVELSGTNKGKKFSIVEGS